MKSEYAHYIKGNFYSNGGLAKNLPLWASDIRELANHPPLGEVPFDFCGEWQ